jgi:hypothetical protein
MDHKTEVENASHLLLALAGDIRKLESRVARSGDWCYFCASPAIVPGCKCGLPESLRCANRNVCADCREAHRAIASHLQRTFKAKITDRVSSVRAKLFFQLHSAAEELYGEDSNLPPEAQLHVQLAQADPYSDEAGEFRATVLKSFGKVKFVRFQELSKWLAIEQDLELKNNLARFFASCAFYTSRSTYKP